MPTPPSKSPGRHTFARAAYIERCLKEDTLPDPEMLKYYDSIKAQIESQSLMKENNLEYDLRTTDWMLAKVRTSNDYAQNLYAALCNNDWRRAEVMTILKGESWSCSWRYAGGIIANMREEGDYIDWYCSGIRNDADVEGNDETIQDVESKKFVSESVITDEIREDLRKLGWIEAEEKNA